MKSLLGSPLKGKNIGFDWNRDTLSNKFQNHFYKSLRDTGQISVDIWFILEDFLWSYERNFFLDNGIAHIAELTSRLKTRVSIIGPLMMKVYVNIR